MNHPRNQENQVNKMTNLLIKIHKSLENQRDVHKNQEMIQTATPMKMMTQIPQPTKIENPKKEKNLELMRMKTQPKKGNQKIVEKRRKMGKKVILMARKNVIENQNLVKLQVKMRSQIIKNQDNQEMKMIQKILMRMSRTKENLKNI